MNGHRQTGPTGPFRADFVAEVGDEDSGPYNFETIAD
jgi:hypothetical protein